MLTIINTMTRSPKPIINYIKMDKIKNTIIVSMARRSYCYFRLYRFGLVYNVYIHGSLISNVRQKTIGTTVHCPKVLCN